MIANVIPKVEAARGNNGQERKKCNIVNIVLVFVFLIIWLVSDNISVNKLI